MIAMQFERIGQLSKVDLPKPSPATDELLAKVSACGVCHTDLHIVEGELKPHRLPIIPGHQVVGRVEAVGAEATDFKIGERVGIAWLHRTCGECRFCRAGDENLCERAEFTGLHADGGFAEYATVPADFAYRIPEGYSDEEAAPLLCAGIVGYRSLKRSRIRPGGRLGLYGFGGSAHIVLQVARQWGCEVSVFTRSSNHQAVALELGAARAGRAEDAKSESLDSAIIFAPAGALVPMALKALDKGGTLALAGIYMSQIPALDYADVYHERTITSVANATRADGRDFLALAAKTHITTRIETFPLAEANRALQMLKDSKLQAAAVLKV